MILMLYFFLFHWIIYFLNYVKFIGIFIGKMLGINDNKKSIFVELLRLFRILPLFLRNTRFLGWEKLAHLRPLLSDSHNESSDTQVKREPPPQTCFHKYWEYISKYQFYSKLQDKHPRRQKNTLNSFFFSIATTLPLSWSHPKAACILFS